MFNPDQPFSNVERQFDISKYEFVGNKYHGVYGETTSFKKPKWGFPISDPAIGKGMVAGPPQIHERYHPEQYIGIYKKREDIAPEESFILLTEIPGTDISKGEEIFEFWKVEAQNWNWMDFEKAPFHLKMRKEEMEKSVFAVPLNRLDFFPNPIKNAHSWSRGLYIRMKDIKWVLSFYKSDDTLPVTARDLALVYINKRLSIIDEPYPYNLCSPLLFQNHK